MNQARVFSINYSKTKGIAKTPIKQAWLIAGHGLDGDAHAGDAIRQVSLLSIESIRKQKECLKVKKPDFQLSAGDFAENITTEGIDLSALKIGDKLRLGDEAVIEISKIGKDCHKYCAIYYKIGDCIMPKEGIFARVVQGGCINTLNKIEVIND